MNYAATLCLVLAATYSLGSLLLSMLVAVLWRTGLERKCSTPGDLLALRLFPSAGALFLTVSVVLPAFLIYEPHHELEQVGPLLVLLGLLALGTLVGGVVRGWRAWTAAQSLLRNRGPLDPCYANPWHGVEILDIPEPIVAVVGAWRPRMVAARSVVAACSHEEIRQVIAHEAAHVSAHDNLKLLLLLVSPDALGWTPTGKVLIERWREAAEFAADSRATGSDPCKRLALASALVKVVRLSSGTRNRSAVLGMTIAVDDVAGRVRQLLAPPTTSPGTRHPQVALIGALLLAVLVVPLYARVQEFVEALVAFGR